MAVGLYLGLFILCIIVETFQLKTWRKIIKNDKPFIPNMAEMMGKVTKNGQQYPPPQNYLKRTFQNTYFRSIEGKAALWVRSMDYKKYFRL